MIKQFTRIGGLVALGLATLACAVSPTVNPVVNKVPIDAVYKVIATSKSTSTTVMTGSCVAVQLVDMHTQPPTYEVWFLTAKHVAAAFNRGDVNMSIAKLGSVSGLTTDSVQWSEKVIQCVLHPTKDVAIMKIAYSQPLAVASIYPGTVKTNESITCAGFPMDLGIVITEGRVGHYNMERKLIQASADIMSGSSGGPVFDTLTGKLIGITVSLIMEGDPNIPFGPSQKITFLQYFEDLSSVQSWLEEGGIPWPKIDQPK